MCIFFSLGNAWKLLLKFMNCFDSFDLAQLYLILFTSKEQNYDYYEKSKRCTDFCWFQAHFLNVRAKLTLHCLLNVICNCSLSQTSVPTSFFFAVIRSTQLRKPSFCDITEGNTSIYALNYVFSPWESASLWMRRHHVVGTYSKKLKLQDDEKWYNMGT